MQSTFSILQGNYDITLTFHHTALYHLVHKLHHQHPCGLQIPKKKIEIKMYFPSQYMQILINMLIYKFYISTASITKNFE